MGVWGLRGDGGGVSASGSGVSAGKTAGGTAGTSLAGGSTWVEDHDGGATLVEAMGSTCVEALCARGRWWVLVWGWGAVAAAAAGWQHPGGGALVVAVVVAVVAVVVVLTVLVL